jgi:aspartyl-tRNA(Asn)/glutamyl-tRNA(Gln) amidotransferase subunit A
MTQPLTAQAGPAPATSQPPYLTIAAAGRALRAGETSSVELVRAALDQADRLDDLIGTFLSRFPDTALAAAAQADRELADGVDRGPLHGIPLGIKDIIATDEGETTAQSLILDRDWGAGGDAVVVARLRAGGGIIVGKSTTMEFAIGLPDPEKPFPIPRNPWDPQTWPGGSSSGTGSGVAAGMFLGGLGTDTGGSIRIPSAMCGITGLKPTFGRVPKSGCVPLGYLLDNIGPMARSAQDCASMLGVLAGRHPSDHTSADVPVGDYTAALTGDLHGVRIGVDDLARFSTGMVDADQPDRFRAALAWLADAGAELVDVELPYYTELTASTMVTMMGEAAAYHLPDLRNRWTEYGAATRTLIAGGVLHSAADYVQAQRVRRVGQQALAALLERVDLVVTPTTTAGAPKLADFDLSDPMNALGGIHTPYWNATGSPTVSTPIGFTAAGLPLGLQISGRPFDEAGVLRAADAYQRRTDWHLRIPPLEGT